MLNYMLHYMYICYGVVFASKRDSMYTVYKCTSVQVTVHILDRAKLSPNPDCGRKKMSSDLESMAIPLGLVMFSLNRMTLCLASASSELLP